MEQNQQYQPATPQALKPDLYEQPLHPSQKGAVAAIRSRGYLDTIKYAEQQTRAARDGAHPTILVFEHKFQARMRKLGIPMFAHCVWRSIGDQQAAYALGNSNAKPGESPHQYGCAIDLIHSLKAWDIPKPSWDIIGHIGKEVASQNGLNLVWGGDFRTLYDPAHWELYDWQEYKQHRP